MRRAPWGIAAWVILIGWLPLRCALAADLIIGWQPGAAQESITLSGGEVIYPQPLWHPKGRPVRHSRLAVADERLVEVLIELRHMSAIRYVEIDSRVKAQSLPNDANLDETWHLDKIRAPQAWDSVHDCRQALIAIVDTGIDLTHPDLIDNLWVNTGEIAGNGIDDDDNGIVDDVHGFNAITGTAAGEPTSDYDPLRINMHGTHVAGIAAAVGNNSIGSSGLCWQARLMDARFLGLSGGGDSSDAASAIEYALSMRQPDELLIVNNSWTVENYNQTLDEVIAGAVDAGVLFTMAAGNHGGNNDITPVYPAILSARNPHAISVGNSNQLDLRHTAAGASNYGLHTVDLVAPGSDIYSTLPNGAYGTETGTSMSTPMVAAAAALIDGLRPGMSPSEIRAHLISSAQPLTLLAGWYVNGARLDLAEAVNQLHIDSPTLFYLQMPHYNSVRAGEKVTVVGEYLDAVRELRWNEVALPVDVGSASGTLVVQLPDGARSGSLAIEGGNQLWLKTVLDPPDLLQITPAPAGSLISWNCGANCESVTIQRATNTLGYNTVATVAADSAVWRDEGAEQGSTLCYRLQAGYEYLRPDTGTIATELSPWSDPISQNPTSTPRLWLTRYLGSVAVGDNYDIRLRGIDPAMSFSALDPLPEGLVLEPFGRLYGTPQAEGVYSFRLLANSGVNCPEERLFVLKVDRAGAPRHQVVNYSGRGYLLEGRVGQVTSLQWRVVASSEIAPTANNYDLLQLDLRLDPQNEALLEIVPTAGYFMDSIQVHNRKNGWQTPVSSDGLAFNSGMISWALRSGSDWDDNPHDEGVVTLTIALGVLGRTGASSSSTLDRRCFIATSLYQTTHHPDLDRLRGWRDHILKLPMGQELVDYYYRNSPRWVDWTSSHPSLQRLMYQLIRLLVWMVEYLYLWGLLLVTVVALRGYRRQVKPVTDA